MTKKIVESIGKQDNRQERIKKLNIMLKQIAFSDDLTDKQVELYNEVRNKFISELDSYKKELLNWYDVVCEHNSIKYKIDQLKFWKFESLKDMVDHYNEWSRHVDGPGDWAALGEFSKLIQFCNNHPEEASKYVRID